MENFIRVLIAVIAFAGANVGSAEAVDTESQAQAEEAIDETSPSPESEAPAPQPSDGATPSETPSQPPSPFFGDEPDPLFDDDYDEEESTGYPDPLQEPNRAVLVFNQGLDTYLLGPFTQFFGFVTPDPVKFGLRNFFANLNMPVVLINDMLQLEWKDAATITGAFVVNSTVGIGGFFDPGKHIGLPRHDSDFGQTLALAQIPSGPYLMLPIAGPSTARGTVGSVVDFFMRPNTWILPLSNIYYYGGEGVVSLEQHHENMKELERSSVDYYSVLRSAYFQTRSEEIWGRREGRRDLGFD